MKRVLLFFVLLLFCVSCASASDNSSTTRILFIGNSYTYVNNLPKMFANLSKSGGHRVETAMSAKAGWTLSDHVKFADTMDQWESSTWDIVILQEQSQIPASDIFREQEMYPAARVLVAKIRELGATPLFFLTPAHLDGWPEEGLPDYASMQAQINIGYWGIANELNAPVAPAGIAWSTVRGQNPELTLWQSDGSHPAEQGTYLTACVFYAVIFHESPQGINYRGNLSKEVAQILQKIASQTVLNTP